MEAFVATTAQEYVEHRKKQFQRFVLSSRLVTIKPLVITNRTKQFSSEPCSKAKQKMKIFASHLSSLYL